MVAVSSGWIIAKEEKNQKMEGEKGSRKIAD